MQKRKMLLCGALVFLLGTACTTSERYEHPFQNPKLTVEERVDNLMSLLTLKEKVSMMINRSLAIERLNIPAYNWWGEACHGLIADGTTIKLMHVPNITECIVDRNLYATSSMPWYP